MATEKVKKRRAETGNVRAHLMVGKANKGFPLDAGEPKDSKVVDPWRNYKGDLALLVPPISFRDLQSVVDTSNILQQCIAVMEVNVDGQGYFFDKRDPIGNMVAPPDDKVAEELEDLTETFDNFNYEHSFTKLRRIGRIDLETFGNSYWEVIRDGRGNIAELNQIPAQSVRLTVREKKAVSVKQKVIRGYEVKQRPRRRRFRRIVQVRDTDGYVYFKEFGDTRSIKASDGKVAPGALKDEDAANEAIHFKIHWTGGPYGMPRWAGNMLSSMGSRASEELNYLYFINGRHYPFAILVSGGMLTAESEKKIQQLLDEGKGLRNAHKVLLLEAESGDGGYDKGSTSVKVEIKPLVDVLPDDALFQKYDKNNRDKVRTSFRFPAVLIGESEDYNRDTVEAAIKVANAQVFDVERNDFDDQVTRIFFPELGAVYHRFKSRSFRPIGITDLSNVMFRMHKMGAVTPRIVLPLVRDMLGIDFDFPEDADWLDRPMELTTELIRQQGQAATAAEGSGIATAEGKKAAALVKQLGLTTEQAAGAVNVVEGLLALRKVFESTIEKGQTK